MVAKSLKKPGLKGNSNRFVLRSQALIKGMKEKTFKKGSGSKNWVSIL